MIIGESSRRKTDERLREMEEHLTGIYTRAYKTLRVRWDEYLLPLDKEIERLRLEMKNATDKDEKKDARKQYTQAVKNRTVRDQRFRDMAANLTENLANVNKTALAYVNGELPDVYAINYNDMGSLVVDEINTVFHAGFSFDLVNAETVRILAAEDPMLLPYKALDVPKDMRWNTKMINSEVLQGILLGEPIPDIAKRLENVVGMNERSSITNARTMVTGAENRGRLESMRRAESDGIVLRRVWMSAEDGRVRNAHAELDGQTRGVDEPFENELGEIMYPGDATAEPANFYNCRCTLGTEIIGFRESDRGKISRVTR